MKWKFEHGDKKPTSSFGVHSWESHPIKPRFQVSGKEMAGTKQGPFAALIHVPMFHGVFHQSSGIFQP